MGEPPPTPGRKVFYVSHHSTIVGGGEISLLTLIKGLRRTSWKPTLVVPELGPLADLAGEAGASVLQAPMPTLRRPGPKVLASVRAIRKQMSERQPDIVHANGTRAMFYGGLGARAAGCPSIWHLRIVEPDPRFDALLIRLASASIANSEAARQRLARWPSSWQRCRVIPNGIDLATFVATADPRVTRERLGLGADATVVVSVSRLVDFKRLDLLLEAVARLRPLHPQLACVIVGEGPAEADLRERAAQDDLEGAVTFAGHRPDIANVLSACDMFVLTSPVESFARTVIEAMAMEVPVVAPAAGGPAEIVAHEATGLLVTPANAAALADAIARLLGDSRLGKRLAAAARRRVEEKYSQQTHTELVLDYYEELLEERRDYQRG